MNIPAKAHHFGSNLGSEAGDLVVLMGHRGGRLHGERCRSPGDTQARLELGRSSEGMAR